MKNKRFEFSYGLLSWFKSHNIWKGYNVSVGKVVRSIKRMKQKNRAFPKNFQYFLRYVFFADKFFREYQ